jgi:putative ABC transport system ATP-binding protein/lipoprotein-releasing system ATP-binding protein
MGIIASGIGKKIGNPEVRILSDISLDIRSGEFVALTGRSGSGKSTLLYILSTLDFASEGTVEIDGGNVALMSAQETSVLRNEKIGFVFQFHYLLAELTALENVLMPARKTGKTEELTAYARELLASFGLEGKEGRLPRQLSGGEQQRLAIARALLMKPRYLFADEPTGSLDSINSEIVMKIIRDSNQKYGTTVIMVTHDLGFARWADRRIHLVDGRIAPIPTTG